MDIWLTLPVPPVTNTRLKADRGRLYRHRKNSDYQDVVRLECISQRVRPFPGDVSMSIHWYRESRRGDLTDRWKDVCDALQSVKKDNNTKKMFDTGFGAYYDDKQIACFSVHRTEDPKNPRIIVHIRPYDG